MVKTSENDRKADLEVFDDEDDAKKAAADVLGTRHGHRHTRTNRPTLIMNRSWHDLCLVLVGVS